MDIKDLEEHLEAKKRTRIAYDRIKSRRYYQKHKERILALNKEYYLKNREKRIKQMAEWRKRNPDYFKKYHHGKQTPKSE